MPANTKSKDVKVGLGKLIYSVDGDDGPEAREEHARDSARVTAASKASFPASDPPEFTGAVAEGND